MKILLDLDDTIIMNGESHPLLDDFMNFVHTNNHEVTVWSSNEDIAFISHLMGFPCISKDSNCKPHADVLIDDCAYLFVRFCCVERSYGSLDSFMATI